MTIEPRTLVWIDAEQAIIVRWDGAPRLTRIESEVPSHRRLGGQVRRDVNLRTRGSPPPDPHREEHMRQFLRLVADRLAAGDDLELIGPGTVHEHLAVLLKDEDRVHGRLRTVLASPAGLLTDAQLIARVRTAAGDPPRRGRRGAASVA